MPTVPPGRYGSEDFRLNSRIDALIDGAPLDLDTLVEIAQTLQSLQARVAELESTAHDEHDHGDHDHLDFLLLE